MAYIHEPIEEIIYIIRGKYASLLNDVLREEHKSYTLIGDMMAHAFDGTYYLDENGDHNENLMDFSLREDGDLEIVLKYYDMDKALPKFLLWKFPDIDIRIYDVQRSDAWWWSCRETIVSTNDPEGAKAIGLDAEGYYKDLVAKFQEKYPENIKCENGVCLLREKCDDEGDCDNRWTPITEYFKFDFNVIELKRPVTPPVKISLPDPMPSDEDSFEQTDSSDEEMDLPF